MIHCQYSQEAWTHVYTDGSATNAIQDGGAVLLFSTKMALQKQPVQLQEHSAAITEQSQKH